MWPLRFVMPHDPSMRPAWMIRLGLFLYDHLARREVLPGSRTVDLRAHPAGAPLQAASSRRGFVYSDGWVDDARLVVLCAVDAAERGADRADAHRAASTRARARRALAGARCERATAARAACAARALVNAAGPVGGAVPAARTRTPPAASALRLVKGSHIVVPKLFEHDHAYIFQNADGRIIFAIPYEGDFTLIGTTDVEHHGAIGEARIDAAEIDYLCDAGEPLLRAAGDAGAGGLDLQRRAAAARRRVRRPGRGDARLPARARHGRRRAAAVGLGRQDHDLPQARRGGGRPARAGARRRRLARRLDRRRVAARRRPARLRSAPTRRPTPTSTRPSRASSTRSRARHPRGRAGARAPPRARLRHARASRCSTRGLGAEVAPGVCTRRARAPARQRVGAQRRRRPLAAQQARPAPRRAGRAP